MGQIRNRHSNGQVVNKLQKMKIRGELDKIYEWLAHRIWYYRIGFTDTGKFLAGEDEVPENQIIGMLIGDYRREYPHIAVSVRNHMVRHIWKVTVRNAHAKMATLPDGHIEVE